MLEFLNTNIPNPIAFTVFGLDIRWYGICIASGILIGMAILYYWRAPKHDFLPDYVLDGVLICVPMAVIGARAYYVFFEWERYAGNWKEIINIRGGGLAIHGGMIFGLGTAVILCLLVWKHSPLDVLDMVAPSFVLAQAIGRWGNYFNSEAHGGPCDLPWAIPVNGEMVHPTFLYESLWCFLLFILLLIVDNHRQFKGQTFLIYMALYSLERFFVEGLRTDSLMIGQFRQAQVISAGIVAAAIILYAILYIRYNNKKGKHAKENVESKVQQEEATEAKEGNIMIR